MLSVNLIHENNINEQLMSLVPPRVLDSIGNLSFTITAWNEETGDFIGYLVYSSHESVLRRAVLNYIYVLEEYREQRVGSRLLKSMMDKLKSIDIKEIEVDLLDYVGGFEDSLNFFLDRGFEIDSYERGIISYSRDEIVNNKLLKESIDKYSSLSEIKGIQIYADNDSRENLKHEIAKGYENPFQVKKQEDLSFCMYDDDKMIVMALCTLHDGELFYFVYDSSGVKINKTDIANIFVATAVAIKSSPDVQKVSFAINDKKIFQGFMVVFGERDDLICSQRLVVDLG